MPFSFCTLGIIIKVFILKCFWNLVLLKEKASSIFVKELESFEYQMFEFFSKQLMCRHVEASGCQEVMGFTSVHVFSCHEHGN